MATYKFCYEVTAYVCSGKVVLDKELGEQRSTLRPYTV